MACPYYVEWSPSTVGAQTPSWVTLGRVHDVVYERTLGALESPVGQPSKATIQVRNSEKDGPAALVDPSLWYRWAPVRIVLDAGRRARDAGRRRRRCCNGSPEAAGIDDIDEQIAVGIASWRQLDAVRHHDRRLPENQLPHDYSSPLHGPCKRPVGLSVVGVVSSFVRPRMASAPSAVPDQTPQDE